MLIHPTVFRRFVRRHVDARPRRAVVRLEVGQGEETQVDFGYAGLISRASGEAPAKTWVFVMTLPIPPQVVPCLEHALAASASEYMFPGPDGGMRSKDNDMSREVVSKHAGLVEGYDHVCREDLRSMAACLPPQPGCRLHLRRPLLRQPRRLPRCPTSRLVVELWCR